MKQIKAALLGRELSHSISDRLHSELFSILAPKYSADATGLNYELIELPMVTDIKEWIQAARSKGYIGANITYPYKDNAYESAERHVGASGIIRSANTIKTSSAIIESASTDGQGFFNAVLRKFPEFHLDPYHLVVLGAGAAAKAVVYSLCTKWMPLSLTIVNRSNEQAQALAEFCLAESPGPSVRIMSINDFITSFPEQRRRMVIQATPLGQQNHPGNIAAGFQWNDSDLAADLVYHPLETKFIQDATTAGAKTVSGLGMLIEQGALSQVFWFSGLSPERSPLNDEEFQRVYSTLSPFVQ